MEPHYFGARGELFGMFHSPVRSIKNKAVLIVPPLFSDYMRSHRALRQTALRLSEQGFPVMRFDFRGTGDSFGALAELTCDDWIADVATAADELRDIAGVDRLCVITVRYGALLVADASANTAFDTAVLWDPQFRGDDLVDELTAGRGAYGKRARKAIGEFEVLGYRASQSFVESWRGVHKTGVRCRQRIDVLTIGHASEDPASTTHRVEFDCAWKKGQLDEILYPHQVLGTLSNALS